MSQDYLDQILKDTLRDTLLYDFSSVMERCYPETGDFLESSLSSYMLTALENVFMYEKSNNGRPEYKTEGFEEDEPNERPQDNDSQTSTPSCISKMDYTLPKYRNNVSPAIDKLMRMINMPSLITDTDSSNSPTNRISSPEYCRDDKENFAVPIMTREYLDICFSSPRPFVSTYKRVEAQSRTKEIDRLLSQIGQDPTSGWQEIVELPNGEPIVDSPCYEVKEMPP